MKLLVCTRHELLDRPPPRNPAAGGLSADAPTADAALMLEGSWPGDTPFPACRSLDEAIDGRFDGIDQQAADWVEMLAEPAAPAEGNGSLFEVISPAWLNALSLRYYLVKLLRALVYLTEVQPLRAGDCLELTAAATRDDDYAEVLSQLCRLAGVHCRVSWVRERRRRGGGLPANACWRRWAGCVSRALQPPVDHRGSGRRVVLCGNPRLLDPVCRGLLARGCRMWWLYDRFAIKSWLKWQATGAAQLVCNSSLGRENRLHQWRLGADLQRHLDFRGVSLAAPVERWLSRRTATHGPCQTRLIEQIDGHFRHVRPDALVLDEDATPMARAAVAVGRWHGVRSLVVQHGAPYCRFGFAPLAADRILVWGRSSRQRLAEWGVPLKRIGIAGLPDDHHVPWTTGDEQHAPVSCQPGSLGSCTGGRTDAGYGWGGSTTAHPTAAPRGGEVRRPRILLLTTAPPREDRPDAVALHLSSRTYAEMVRMAFATVAGIYAAELIVKLHPRAADDPVVSAVRAEFSGLQTRVVRRGPLGKWLAGADCALSCGSSAGVEATIYGVPVIQLAPPGASGFLPHDEWGLAGTARCQAELRQLLARVLVEGWPPGCGPDSNVFARIGEPAAARIADEVLALEETQQPFAAQPELSVSSS